MSLTHAGDNLQGLMQIGAADLKAVGRIGGFGRSGVWWPLVALIASAGTVWGCNASQRARRMIPRSGLLRAALDALRMHRDDSGIPHKIPRVEGE